MQSLQPDYGIARGGFDALGEAEHATPAGSPMANGRETGLGAAEHARLFERRETPERRVIGRLVSLNGTQAVIHCRLEQGGEDWSVGHLITVASPASRMVGIVCEMGASAGRWSETGVNDARVAIELSGEVVDDASGAPVFHRGVRSFPSLGAPAHRIRAEDLRAVYSFHGREAVEIGRLSQNEAIPAEIDIGELTGRHFAVLGSTGVGKTTAVSLLLRKSVGTKPKLRVIVFDPHNEYAAHFPDLAQVIDSDSLELPFWVFRFEEFADIIFSGRHPHADERDALYEIIRMARARYLVDAGSPKASALRRQPVAEAVSVTADTSTPFRIVDALAIIEEWLGKLDQRFARSDLRGLRFRLEGLNRDPRYRFMFGRPVAEDDIGKVISRLFRIPARGRPITIVRLAGLPNEVVNSVVSVLARLAFEIAFWCAGAFEINVLCEEAHRYIPADSRQGFGPARQAIGRIAKEGRKYGASLGVVSQRPSELDPTVLSQCSTLFAMRLANEVDKDIIRAAAGASAGSTIAFLSSIADREAIAFGEAIATPMRMKFADISSCEDDARPGDRDIDPIDLRVLAAQLRGEAG
jgi:DNA helicase HerA-like ATPase